MGVALRARYRSRDGSMQGERAIHHFPVRLGRNAVNDCVLGHPFVSDFHAVVDWVDGQLCIRDLGSRNGLFSATMDRLPAQKSIPLAQLGFAFVVGRAVEVQVETFEDGRLPGARGSRVEGSVLGNRAALESAPNPDWLDASVRSVAPPGSLPGPGSLPPLSMASPPAVRGPSWDARTDLPASDLQASLPPLSAAGPAYARASGPSAAARDLARPPLAEHPSDDPRSGRPQPVAGPQTQHLAMSLEAMALLGLRELGASLVAGYPLESTGDVARLVTKLHDLVEVVCRLLIPLRDAVGAGASGGGPAIRSPTQRLVATAPDAPSLARALLDWRSHDQGGADAVEQVLTEVLAERAVLADELPRRIADMLEELSPESIERSVSERGGLGAVLGRQRALWQAYTEKFHSQSLDERLERLFGPSHGRKARPTEPPRR